MKHYSDSLTERKFMNSNSSKKIQKAEILYRKKRYEEVVQLLEPLVIYNRENPLFYLLLGLSCLYIKEWNGAEIYIQRAYSLDAANPEITLAVAAIYTYKGLSDKALPVYLRLIDEKHFIKQSKTGLEILKNSHKPDIILNFFQSVDVKKVLPPSAMHIPGWLKSGSLAVLLIILGINILPYATSLFLKEEVSRPEIEKIKIETNEGNYVSFSGDFPFKLTGEEIIESFNSAKNYFQDYDDNQARKELNLIQYSNASPEIKIKVETLQKFITQPTFDTLKSNFNYQEVITDPLLYNSCFIIWKGRLSNLEIGKYSINFDFLVGYHDEKVLEGIVPSELKFAADIDSSLPIEILAKVKSNVDTFSLEVLSYHQFRKTE